MICIVAYDMCCLELLYRQLYPRGAGKILFFKQIEVCVITYPHACIIMYGLHMQTCDIDVEQEILETRQFAPFILITGASAVVENTQFLFAVSKLST